MTDSIRRNDDLLITPVIRNRLLLEGEFDGGPGIYWGVMRRSNGLTMPFRSQMGLPPSEDQQMFAHDMALLLNKEIHHDGAWLTAFTHPSGGHFTVPGFQISATVPYERWLFLWIDRDGDPQFTIDGTQPFYEVIHAGPNAWMESAEAAWEAWQHYMREVLDVKGRHAEGVTFKRAQGERRPSSR